MKNIFKLGLVLIFALGLMGSAMAQTTSLNANAAAKLVNALTITEDVELHFGTINHLDATDGNVVMTPLNTTRTPTANITLMTTDPQPKNGKYTITGTPDMLYDVKVDQKITINNTQGAGSMDISSLTFSFDQSTIDQYSAVFNKTMASTGTQTFTMGGTLNVIGAQPAGLYKGTFKIDVQYN